MKVLKLAVVIFILFLNGAALGAQSDSQQATPPSATPSQSETVSIYVTAATKKGTLIRDLKPEDLFIQEGKVPAKIEKVTCGKPEPLLVGIIVDASGSRYMDSHLAAHYDALEAFLQSLPAGNDAAYVVAYDDSVHKLSELVSDRADISAAFNKLRKHQPVGSTALYDAIKAAAGANFKGRPGRRVLIVMGDWEDNSSHVLGDEALKAAQRTSTTVYAIVDSEGGLESKRLHKRADEVATANHRRDRRIGLSCGRQ